MSPQRLEKSPTQCLIRVHTRDNALRLTLMVPEIRKAQYDPPWLVYVALNG